MKYEKLSSGSYRVRKMIDGKRYSLTFDHRPTQKEIQEEINKRTTGSFNGVKTFRYCCTEYISNRANILSPATQRSYNDRTNILSDWFLNMRIDKITTQDVQKVLDEYSIGHKPKSTKNHYLFIRTVLHQYRPDLILKVDLPALEKDSIYIPTTEDVQKLLEATKGTQLELLIILGSLGLRRGEMSALKREDLNGNYLTISRSMVLGPAGDWIIKEPKTPGSVRTIYVPDRVIELVDTVGFYEGKPASIWPMLARVQDSLGIPHFSIHKLRHYFASQAHAKGMSDADIMKFGGWETDGCMKRIYRHAMEDNSKKVSESIMSDLF